MPRSKSDIDIEADLAITKITIKELAEPSIQTAAVGVVAGLIPYVGGTLASILGEVASTRKMERVCSCLSAISDALERHNIDAERHLTEEQIIEVVHDTIQASLTASDEEKIRLLKNGLGYAFTSKDSFEDKQIFLTILRSLTTHELRLLRKIYVGGDPYRIEVGRPTSGQTGVLTFANGFWRNEGMEPNNEGKSLASYLAGDSSAEYIWVRAAANLIDSKGLASVTPHLDENYKVRFRWIENASLSMVQSLNMFSPARSYVSKDTPLGASKTDFGEKFVRSFY